MLKMICLALCLTGASPSPWHLNMMEARKIAAKEHKHILLNFSGSDWCGPCIRLRKEILDDPAFLEMADTLLVLVNADFPRMKKNQLPKEQQQINDQMADQYNARGEFPLTILLNADGKIIQQWIGYPDMKAPEFCLRVKTAIESDR